MKNTLGALSAAALLLPLSGCNGSKPAIDAAALLEARCGTCHSTDIPKNARKSRRDWNETVDRMISKGAKLSPEEKRILVKHLARIYRN